MGPGVGHFRGHFSKDQLAPPLVAIMTETACRGIAQPSEVRTNLDPTLAPNLRDLELVV